MGNDLSVGHGEESLLDDSDSYAVGPESGAAGEAPLSRWQKARRGLTNYARVVLRIITGGGHGAYFGSSIIAYVFGVFFAPLTGGWSLVPPISALIFSLLFGCKTIRDEKAESMALAAAMARFAAVKAELAGCDNNNRLLQDAAFKQPDNRSWGQKSKDVVFKLIDRALEFTNGSKNITKVLLGTIILFGASVSSFMLGGWPLLLVAGGVVGFFGAACAIDYHIRGTRKQKTAELERCSQLVVAEIRRLRLGDFESGVDLDRVTAKHEFANPLAQKAKNVATFLLNSATGLIRGGYLGFAMLETIGLIFAPLTGGASIIVASVLAGTWLVLRGTKHMNDELKAQSREQQALDRLATAKAKLVALLRQHPTASISDSNNYDQIETFLAGCGESVSEYVPARNSTKGFWANAWEGLKKLGNRGCLFGRAMKDGTKFLLGLLVTLGGLWAAGSLITFGWPVVVLFAGFGITVGLLSALGYHLDSSRQQRVEQLLQQSEGYEQAIFQIQFAAKQQAQQAVMQPISVGEKQFVPEGMKVTAENRGQVTSFEDDYCSDDEGPAKEAHKTGNPKAFPSPRLRKPPRTDLKTTPLFTGIAPNDATGSPRDLSKTGSPRDLSETRLSRDLSKTGSPRDLSETGSPRDLSETRSPRDSSETESPRDLSKTESPRISARA